MEDELIARNTGLVIDHLAISQSTRHPWRTRPCSDVAGHAEVRVNVQSSSDGVRRIGLSTGRQPVDCCAHSRTGSGILRRTVSWDVVV